MLARVFSSLCSSVFAVALAIACSPAGAVPVPGQGTWETELQARDIDHDGVVDAWYDTVQNLTWLADIGPNSSWEQAHAFIDPLSLGGFTDWRLPHLATPANGVALNYDFSWNGDTDSGYNNDRSEMGHLYYVTLGNRAPCAVGSDASIPHDCIDPWPAGPHVVNTGPFHYPAPLQDSYSYWATTDQLYGAMNSDGLQIACSICITTSLGAHYMVVRTGDVLVSPIPEPGTLSLALVGGGLMLWVRRRRLPARR